MSNIPIRACSTGAEATLGPGRPRNPDLDERILEAAIHLLHTGAELTVNALVLQSGVSRAALYRRWPSITQLTAAALDAGRTEYPSIRVDEHLRESLAAALIPGLSSEPRYSLQRFMQRMRLISTNPELQHAYWQSHVARRRKPLEASLHEAVHRGLLRPDLDVEACIDALAGAVYYQLLVRGDDLDAPATRARLHLAFDIVWRGMLPAPGGKGPGPV